MSRFEFIFVLISIVVGLALTQLLSGLTRSVRRPSEDIDIAHVLFSLGTIALLFSIWWNSFRWEGNEVWTFFEYSLIFIYVSTFYVMAEILHPRNSTVVPPFEEVRVSLYVVIVFYNFFEPLVVYVRDGLLSWDYLPLVIHIGVLAAIGLFLRNRTFDRLFSAWYVFVSIAWQFAARLVG